MPTKPRAGRAGNAPPGAAVVDAPYDPSKNVLDLVAAAVLRQDDLRAAQDFHIAAMVEALEKRMILRSAHAAEMRDAESSRLDAVRATDQLAVQQAAQQALTAIQTLSVQNQTNADNIRTQTAATVAQLSDRISALEKASYRGEGKESYADPVVLENQRQIRELQFALQQSSGKSTGQTAVFGYIALAISALVGLITVGTFIFITTRQQSPPPSVIYTPAPPSTMLPSTPPSTVPR